MIEQAAIAKPIQNEPVEEVIWVSRVKVIACSEDPDAISKILIALKNKDPVAQKQKAITGLPKPSAATD